MGTKPQQTSFFDNWVKETLGETGVHLSRVNPTMPVLSGLDFHVESNKAGQVNGVNVVMTFAPGRKAKGEKPAVAGLTISREVKMNADGTIEVLPVNVSGAVNASNGRFKLARNAKAYGSAVSLRFGDESEGEDTYFASSVPTSAGVDAAFRSFADTWNKMPESRDKFREEGILVTRKATQDRSDVTVVQFPADKVRYSPVLFCRIGVDGKPELNLRGAYFSSTNQRGNSREFVDGNPTGRNWQFRGNFFGRGNRSEEIAKSLETQIKSHPKWAEIQAIKGSPFAERSATRQQGDSRFAPQAPMGSGDDSFAPAGTVEEPQDIEL